VREREWGLNDGANGCVSFGRVSLCGERAMCIIKAQSGSAQQTVCEGIADGRICLVFYEEMCGKIECVWSLMRDIEILKFKKPLNLLKCNVKLCSKPFCLVSPQLAPLSQLIAANFHLNRNIRSNNHLLSSNWPLFSSSIERVSNSHVTLEIKVQLE
jgi:hypothetical protein